MSALEPSEARARFFSALKQGSYDALPGIIRGLDSEHLAGDHASTAVLGFAHLASGESSRTGSDPTVIESASVAHRMFQPAHQRAPNDPRLLGFQGSMMMAEGSINDDGETSKQGYFLTQPSSVEWPQWGLFTLAYSLSGQALEALWKALDAAPVSPPTGPVLRC